MYLHIYISIYIYKTPYKHKTPYYPHARSFLSTTKYVTRDIWFLHFLLYVNNLKKFFEQNKIVLKNCLFFSYSMLLKLLKS